MGVRMKKAILILLAAAAAWAQGADPYVGYIYPCGIQAGTTNRLVVVERYQRMNPFSFV